MLNFVMYLVNRELVMSKVCNAHFNVLFVISNPPKKKKNTFIIQTNYKCLIRKLLMGRNNFRVNVCGVIPNSHDEVGNQYQTEAWFLICWLKTASKIIILHLFIPVKFSKMLL